MRLCKSTLTDTVTVHAMVEDGVMEHRQIAPGDVVDLDELIGDITLGERLGPHVASFVDATVVPVEAPALDTPRAKKRGTTAHDAPQE